MDYEKKYKEALERATKAKNNASLSAGTLRVLGIIFPELKESEDEESKKWILEYLYDGMRKSDEQFKGQFKAAISWLEKQKSVGEIVERCRTSWYNEGKIDGMAEGLTNDEKYQQGWHDALEKQGDNNEIAKGILRGAAINLITWIDYNAAEGNMCLSNMECKDIEDALVSGDWDKIYAYIKKKLEKQGEQKDFIPKEEPKFKVGDWIVFNGLTLYVKEVVKGFYRTTSKGGITNSYDWDIDNAARLWTIQDAKDGDVLRLGCIIAMFKKYIGQEKCICYCSISEDGDFEIPIENGEDNIYGCTHTTPATKEQCELLFTKMKEEGYEWDAEKKELRKIEQEQVIDYLVNLPKDNWEFVHEFVEKFGRIPKDEDELNVLVEYVLKRQKPSTWSEKDERIRKELLESFKYQQRESHTDKEWLNGIKLSEVVAWLEKQGEQKPMTEEFEHELAEICNQLLSEIDSEWMNNEILDCIGTSVWLNLCDETAKRYKDGLLKLAKQGEQKPAEWGEEDETTFKVMLEELEKYVMFKQYSTPLSVYDLQWFKSLKDRVQPQPKQEWSVEDETGWTNTMIMIKEVASNHYTKDSIKLVIDWLKSLKERIPQCRN